MRVIRSLLLAGLGLSAVGCGLSPGLYSDGMDSKLMVSTEDAGKIIEYEIIPLTAKTLAKILAKEVAKRASTPIPSPKISRELYDYRIGPYDALNITVWDHPELARPSFQSIVGTGAFSTAGTEAAKTSGHVVDGEGNIFFPHVGEVKVADLTISEARKLLTEKLSKYVPNPQLDMNIAAYRSKVAYVLGEVVNPGALTLGDKPIHVLEAVALMGGMGPQADSRNMRLIRAGKSYPIDFEEIQSGNMQHNYPLQNGDTLTIADNGLNRVFVIGEVNAQGHRTVTIPPGGHLNLADSIASVGGFNLETVDPSKIFVFRFEEPEQAERADTGAVVMAKPKIFHLNASSAEAMLLATKFSMKPLDVVYVGTKDVARWNRAVKQILPTLQAIWYPGRAIKDLDGVIK